MIDKILIATVGLPRSGKTTWALAFSRSNSVPIVCPDAVRYAIHGQRFASVAERYVWATVHAMIRGLFLAGHSHVILDATNVSRKRRDDLKSPDWLTVFHHIDTAPEVCRLRAANDAEILPVIDRMESEFQPLEEDEPRFELLGATDKFPQGSLDETDEGEIRMAIAADATAGIVRIEFGKPVAWLGLPAREARELANLILKNADRI